MKMKRWIGLTAILAMVGNIQASELVYEGFEYTVGSTVNGLNGGTGFSAAWAGSGTANSMIEAGSPAWGSLTVSSNKLRLLLICSVAHAVLHAIRLLIEDVIQNLAVIVVPRLEINHVNCQRHRDGRVVVHRGIGDLYVFFF